MRAEIKQSIPGGCIQPPASKSSMQRALAAALLCKGSSTIINPSDSEDSIAAIGMVECLGAHIARDNAGLIIKGGLNPVCTSLNCGEAGLAVRMFSAIAALTKNEITIEGKGTILTRPMGMLINGLQLLGVHVESIDEKLPLKIRGPIHGGKVSIDGSVSSQFISGLLMALPLVEKDSILLVDSLKSKPYIDLTIDVLKKFGIEIANNNYKEFKIRGRQEYVPASYRVEEDWSGIAFLAVAGAIGGNVRIKGVSSNSVQADIRIVDALRLAGADVSFIGDDLIVKMAELDAFEFDITDCPDLAPPLVALASFCKGKSVLKGSSRLVRKESNRALTLSSEFRKIGVNILVSDDTMEIDGVDAVKGNIIDSHGDHRIAMALAVAATRSAEPIIIEGAESVNKSYPGFFDDLRTLGIVVKTENKNL